MVRFREMPGYGFHDEKSGKRRFLKKSEPADCFTGPAGGGGENAYKVPAQE
jgi:hypothetical protein